jgi:hypothetical protein
MAGRLKTRFPDNGEILGSTLALAGGLNCVLPVNKLFHSKRDMPFSKTIPVFWKASFQLILSLTKQEMIFVQPP